MLCRLNVLCLLPLLISAQNVASGQPPQQYACNMEIAEECFSQLFDQMPICSASEESAELAFRCVHYNVLDACFARPTEPRIKCAPKQIGQAARMAYGKRVDFCLFTSREQQQKQQQQQQHSSDKNRGPGAFIETPRVLPLAYWPHQLSCSSSPSLAICKFSAVRPSIGNRLKQKAATIGDHKVCATAPEAMPAAAKAIDEIRQRQPPPHFVLERHRLLRVKLDASSKLLQFPETRPEDECLMVRSVLSDIYLIHQKYCFHATVTKCMCERLKFERTCGIQCANLEPFGLPLNRELSWNDFRGRLNGAPRTRSQPQGMPYIVMLILTMIVSVAYVNRVGP
uniref:Uncharacterized protein n=1 Tax=Globodera rostochiensis TaxID=31243 RepID=A0A914GXS4_GLORO